MLDSKLLVFNIKCNTHINHLVQCMAQSENILLAIAIIHSIKNLSYNNLTLYNEHHKSQYISLSVLKVFLCKTKG